MELKQGSAGSLASEGGRITANGTAVKGDASANAGGTVEMTGGSVDGAATADNGTIETEIRMLQMAHLRLTAENLN